MLFRSTPVNIINQPYKVGLRDGVIYLEAHPPLEEDREHFARNGITEVVKLLITVTDEDRYEIDWDLVRTVVDEARGVPVAIGMNIAVPATRQVQAADTQLPQTAKTAAGAGARQQTP